MGIPCPIATFHSTGNAIIHVNAPEEKLNIVDNSRLYFVIRDYFRGSVMQNESIVNKLIMFFASYFDAPYEGDDFNAFFNNIAKANYSTMRSDLEDFKCQVIDARTKKSVTIQNEVLRSHQEVEIANFLYLNNIDFIRRNSQQIPKQLISPKRIEAPIVIYTYDSTFKGRDGNRRSGANYALASAVETAIGQLLEYKKKENKEPGPILFLGRFGFDGDHLERSGLFEYSSRGSKIKSVKYPKLDITFMTAHSSKGLGYDDVILLGCTNYNRNGTGCNNVVNKKLFYDQMGYEMEEAEAVRTEKTAVVWKSPNQQTASTLSASQSAPQSTADRRLEDDSIEIVLADIPPVMHGNYELNHLIFTVVKALQNISRVRYYGATVLAEVLKGTDSKKIFDSKLDKLPEFGALRDMPYDTIKSVIDWMIAEHLILKTKGKYPVLHSTHEGLHYSEVMTEGKLKGLKKYLEGEAIV